MTLNSAEEIKRMAIERKAIILAHHYQSEEVKEIADYTGDSYGLSVIASESDAEVIVLCGVRFMAESAAILSPQKKVLLPVAEAGCPLADTITEEDIIQLREENPGVPVVSYVNTTASVKAQSDYCCTSTNAVAVVRSINSSQVIFVPDKNLADYVARRLDKKIISWPGFCHVHERVLAEDVSAAKDRYPEALFVAHPECRPEVLSLADEISSTTGIFKFIASSKRTTFIVGTEEGVGGRLRRENPGKTFIFPSAGMICPNMKKTKRRNVVEALLQMKHEIAVDDLVAEKARKALKRMLYVTG